MADGGAGHLSTPDSVPVVAAAPATVRPRAVAARGAVPDPLYLADASCLCMERAQAALARGRSAEAVWWDELAVTLAQAHVAGETYR